MGDLHDLVKNRDYKKTRQQRYKQESKDRLSKMLKKKVQTTMIGALSSIEEHFSFLWGDCSTEEQRNIKEIYNKIRSEILDKGNHQARNIDAELAQYDVEWLKYHVQIPVIQKEDNKDD